MKRAVRILLVSVWCFWVGIFSSHGQNSAIVKGATEYIDQDIERHRWELSINVGGLLKLGADGVYPYILKINNCNKRNTRAWRFSLSPFLEGFKQYPGDTSANGSHQVRNYNFNPLFVIGHEWQRRYGRTTFFGGLDVAGQLHRIKGTAYDAASPFGNSQGIKGTRVDKYQHDVFWLSTFLGGKFFLNHRFSLSIESHIRFISDNEKTTAWFDGELAEKNLTSARNIEPQPRFFLGLSYHF